jgi:hypothetical protein
VDVPTASRTGLGLASLGTALQLAGLSWDALLHHFDPGLAAREEVVSLANPSHLLLVGGLGLTALGVVLVLLALGWPRRANGHRGRAPLAAAAALLALSGGLAGVGFATGGLGEPHQHAHPDDNAAAAVSAVLSTPTFAALQTTLREQGTPAALDQLEALASTDQAVLTAAHEYAHAIGKLSLDRYGSAQQAFGLCRETFQSGCYHGVLEAYLERNPRLRPAEIATLCDRSITPDAALALRFQCLHGLGHGLTANAEHDIFRALRLCDALNDDWDRGSCYSGVFMENIIFATHQADAANGGPLHDHGAGHKVYLDAADPLYPCNVVDERYKRECFVMQTSAILLFNGHNLRQAIVECDRAEAAYIHLCYQSLGRDISSDTYRDPQQALQLCLLGQPAYRGYCFLGAAKNMIDVTWRTDQALQLCKSVPADDKPLCYNAIGEQLANLYPDPDRRIDECAQVEPTYRPACAEGAGLLRTG